MDTDYCSIDPYPCHSNANCADGLITEELTYYWELYDPENTLDFLPEDQSNFGDYPISRMNDAPLNVHLHLEETSDVPSGAGEPMVPTFAPALGNAIFNATGKRVRNLPIRPEDILNA
mgnify:CR=1 FL=1